MADTKVLKTFEQLLVRVQVPLPLPAIVDCDVKIKSWANQ